MQIPPIGSVHKPMYPHSSHHFYAVTYIIADKVHSAVAILIVLYTGIHGYIYEGHMSNESHNYVNKLSKIYKASL